MLDIISKNEYWETLDLQLISRNHHSLKNVQDGFILRNTYLMNNKKILEIGGGDSRVIQKLSQKNECWMLDKFEGNANGLIGVPSLEKVKIVKDFMGSFNPEVPDNYFDCVFSISVIEHVPVSELKSFFTDCARVLKPGGRMLHAIDINITDKELNHKHLQVEEYLKILNNSDFPLKFVEPPKIDEYVSYKCTYASNPNNQMYSWIQINPKSKEMRSKFEGVSIKMEMIKVK